MVHCKIIYNEKLLKNYVKTAIQDTYLFIQKGLHTSVDEQILGLQDWGDHKTPVLTNKKLVKTKQKAKLVIPAKKSGITA